MFKVFVAFLAHLRIKWFKHGLFGTKLSTQHYLVNVIVLKWLELNTIFMYLKLRTMFRFLCCFLAFLAFSRLKWFKHGLFGTKLGTQHYFVYDIVLKWLESKKIVICLKLHAKLHL